MVMYKYIFLSRFSKTLSSIRESAVVATGGGAGMVRSVSSSNNTSESGSSPGTSIIGNVGKASLLKSSSVDVIKKDVSGGEYM